MLGHVVARYLREQAVEVITSEERYNAQPRDPLVETVRDSGCSWVINALGRTKQKSQDNQELLQTNGLFPIHLKSRLRPGQRMIHASTDCVFTGERGNYECSHETDAADAYGFSKVLGEQIAEMDRCFVFRTSIIGPETQSAHGLMAWFLRQDKANGFLNHHWNGITTLDWAKLCLEAMRGQIKFTHPILQIGIWPSVSKYEMLVLMGQVWGHPIPIHPTNAPSAINRVLVPELLRPPLRTQLDELKAWY